MNKIFKGRVEKQRLVLQDPNEMRSYIASLDGQDIEMTIGRKIDKRTHNQNDYLWFINRLISEETGMEAEDVHTYLKERFAPKRKVTIKGVETTMPKGTSQFTKEEFSDYIERIKRFGSMELNLIIPDSDELI